MVNERTTNWTIVPYPTVGWARQVHPGLTDEEALARLSEQILHVCRLDEATRLCQGCLRTTHEIARWPYADAPERLEILQRLRERRRRAGRTSEADSRPRRRASVSAC